MKKIDPILFIIILVAIVMIAVGIYRSSVAPSSWEAQENCGYSNIETRTLKNCN